MKLKLYHCPFACSGVTMNALEETRLEYDDQLVNIGTGEQKRPEYLAVHPDGKVPALAVDDEVLTENPSILMFLHGIAPDAKLLPDVGIPMERAQQASDLVWCSATVHPMVRQIRMPVRFTDGDPSGVQAKGHEYLHNVCARVDERLDGNDWWYGAKLVNRRRVPALAHGDGHVGRLRGAELRQHRGPYRARATTAELPTRPSPRSRRQGAHVGSPCAVVPPRITPRPHRGAAAPDPDKARFGGDACVAPTEASRCRESPVKRFSG